MNKVYLAGGFKSNWHKKLTCIEGFKWYNPAAKESDKILSLAEYISWDTCHIKKSDILFVYIESTNPSCIGLSAEIGYANALGKTIITIIEPDNLNFKDRYFDFLRGLSSVVYDNLEQGIDYLKNYQ